MAIEDELVHHNYIKRLVADWEMDLTELEKPSLLPDTGKKVAIVGGEPCGLSAAYYLKHLGQGVKILHAKPALGGMLRYGIPEYRQPKKTLNFEIQEILDLGVDVALDVELGKEIVEYLEANHDAVLLAMGAWDNSSQRCDGEDLEGVKGFDHLAIGDKQTMHGKCLTCHRLNEKDPTDPKDMSNCQICHELPGKEPAEAAPAE